MALMMRNHPPSPIPHPLRPGIYRIPSVLGPRPFSQYVLKGERMMLVDTGINTTPADVILPWFEANELDIAALDLVLNSHADVDHCGGNHAIRQAAPNAVFMAGDFDTRWIENRELMLAERYGWYEKHGPEVDYDAETKAFLKSALGLDMPIDQHSSVVRVSTLATDWSSRFWPCPVTPKATSVSGSRNRAPRS